MRVEGERGCLSHPLPSPAALTRFSHLLFSPALLTRFPRPPLVYFGSTTFVIRPFGPTMYPVRFEPKATLQ
jgi:hypothetical protein